MKKQLPTNEEIELIDGNVKVVLSWIGEGYNGDYNSEDPEDRPLLRFDIYSHESIGSPYGEQSNGLWEMLSNASYCTQLVATDKKTARKALHKIMDEVKEAVENWRPIKKICERLSWLSDSDFK